MLFLLDIRQLVFEICNMYFLLSLMLLLSICQLEVIVKRLVFYIKQKNSLTYRPSIIIDIHFFFFFLTNGRKRAESFANVNLSLRRKTEIKALNQSTEDLTDQYLFDYVRIIQSTWNVKY